MNEPLSFQGAGSKFQAGLAAPWRGLAYMKAHPTLWRFSVMPHLLNISVTLVILVGAASSAIAFGVYIHPRFADNAWGWVAEGLAILGLIAITAGVAVVCWVLAGALFSDHFNGQLARAVEISLGTPVGELCEQPAFLQIGDALRTAAFLLTVDVGLLALNCIPVAGSLVAIILAVWVNTYVFGASYLDYPSSLRGWSREEKRQFVRRHKPATVGLGASALAANLVPIVGGLLLAMAVVGAVLLWHDLEVQDPSRED